MSDMITVAIEMPADPCARNYYITGRPNSGCPQVYPTTPSNYANVEEESTPCGSNYWAFYTDEYGSGSLGYECADINTVFNYARGTGVIPTIANSPPIEKTFPSSPGGGGAHGEATCGSAGNTHSVPRGFMVVNYDTATLDWSDIQVLSSNNPNFVNKNSSDAYYNWNINYMHTGCGFMPYNGILNIPTIADQLNTNILPYFCFQDVTGCPGGTGTSNNCPRILGTGADGDFCRGWARTNQTGASFNGAVNNKAVVDSAMENYCNNNYTNPECECLSRGLTGAVGHDAYEAFAQIQSLTGVIDACWYIPCKSGSSDILITSDFISPTCPTNVCENILEFINNQGSNINFGQYQSSVSCNIGGGTGGTGGTGGNGGPTLWQKIWSHKWLFGGLLLLFIIIVIVIIFLSHRHGKKV